MTEKLQEWIAAVEAAISDASVEAATVRQAVSYSTSPSWQAKHSARAREADTRAALLAEVAAHLRDGGWLPIESAPKDKRIHVAWQEDGEWLMAFDVDWYEQGNCWYHERAGTIHPSHWMPLPAPPAALATPGEG